MRNWFLFMNLPSIFKVFKFNLNNKYKFEYLRCKCDFYSVDKICSLSLRTLNSRNGFELYCYEF